MIPDGFKLILDGSSMIPDDLKPILDDSSTILDDILDDSSTISDRSKLQVIKDVELPPQWVLSS